MFYVFPWQSIFQIQCIQISLCKCSDSLFNIYWIQYFVVNLVVNGSIYKRNCLKIESKPDFANREGSIRLAANSQIWKVTTNLCSQHLLTLLCVLHISLLKCMNSIVIFHRIYRMHRNHHPACSSDSYNCPIITIYRQTLQPIRLEDTQPTSVF